MSEFRIDQISNQTGTAGPNIAGITTFSSTSGMLMPSGPEEYRGGRGRGLFAGGYTPSIQNVIDFITISTASNATDFGDLSQTKQFFSSCSSSVRGVFGGGDSPTYTNRIDYVTIASTGNSFFFGDLTLARRGIASCASSTRGVFIAGTQAAPSNNGTNLIEYITIASLGNSTNFGNLLSNERAWAAACSSPTRGVVGGGRIASNTLINSMEYITIASNGNALDFGDLSQARGFFSSCSSQIRGIFGGGYTPTRVNTIDFITIASLGDAIDFGDLTQSRGELAACSSPTRGVFGAGFAGAPAGVQVNTIDYITIATTGNATTFGSLTLSRGGIAACSDAHGGLGD